MELPSATPSSPAYLLSYRLRGRRGGTDGLELERRRWGRPLSPRGLCFPYVSLWLPRSRAAGASGGGGEGAGCVCGCCVSAARVLALGAFPASPGAPAGLQG